MGKLLTFFKIILIVQLFYGISISLIASAVEQSPLSDSSDLTPFTSASYSNSTGLTQGLESSLENQLNIPVLDFGALVYYSGNLLINVLFNSLYAIPEMIGFLIYALELIFSFNHIVTQAIQLFFVSMATLLYVLGLLELLTSIRSSQGIN